MAKVRGDQQTGDLFAGEFFPVRRSEPLPRALDFKRSIATAMGQAVRDSGKTVPAIAAEMTELLGDDIVTGAQLYAYTSEARTSHTISIVRWVAFVRATGQTWLWDFLLQNEGLHVFQGAEALHAQASMAEAQARELLSRARQMRSAAPLEFSIKPPPRGRRGK